MWFRKRRVERWTMTRAAAAVHAAVLRDAGYVRDGRRCRRRDFIVREVIFDAQPDREVWERAALPSFDLSWIDPTARPAPVAGRTTIGIGLPGAPFDMPPLDVSEAPAQLVREVADIGLPYLELPSSPEHFIELLLEPDRIRADRHPYPDLTHYAMAANGALIHDDKPSFQRALALWAQEVVDMPSLQGELVAMEQAATDRRGWKVT